MDIVDIAIAKANANGGGSGLPEVTEADNGKILMVVDGKWQAVLIPMAEESEF